MCRGTPVSDDISHGLHDLELRHPRLSIQRRHSDQDPADVVDLAYLSIPITRAVERSSDAAEEDAFCERLRRVGATWWAYYGEWLDNYEQHDEYRVTAEQKRTMVYGWPTNVEGVWVLRYWGDGDVPGDLGRVRMARSMEERIEVMKGFGAEFVADPTHVEELQVPV